MRVRDPGVGVAVFCVAVAALALRVLAFGHGYSTDELSNLYQGPWWRVLGDAEVAVNPPLLRAFVNALAPEWAVPWTGRVLAAVASVATVGVLARTAARLTGRWGLAAVFAGAVWAVMPVAVKTGAELRSYGLLGLLFALHLDALTVLRAQPDDRGARRLRLVTAVAMPWIHYISVPVLLGLGTVGLLRGDRGDRVRAYVPAAIGILPVTTIVFFTDETRVATPESAWWTLVPIAGFGLDVPDALWVPISTALRPFGVGPTAHHAVATVAVLVAAAVLAVRDRRGGRSAVGVEAAWVVLASVMSLMPFQYPRSPIGVLLLIALLPRIGAAWQREVAGATRGLFGAGVAVLWCISVVESRRKVPREDDVAWFFAHWRAFDDLRGRGPVVVEPASSLQTAYFYLEHDHWMTRPPVPPPECGADPVCFVHDGVAFHGGAQALPTPGLYVAFETYDRALHPEATSCRRLVRRAGAELWACPPEAR
ncbi:MAG: hypothetical protein RLZZ383_2009 [Pseudomonadota bacterium]|jgi:hypothetical protein